MNDSTKKLNEYDNLHRIFVDKESENRYKEKAIVHDEKILSIINNYNIGLKDILEHFPSFIQRRHLPKIFALYDIFNQVKDMPGSIAEFGVYKGCSLFTWLHILETFLPNERMKKIYAFDHFKGYKSYHQKDTSPKWVIDKHGGCNLDDSGNEFIKELLKLHNNDSFLPGVERVVVIDGDIIETVPKFKELNMGVRFSIINIDVNLYEPVKVILENFYEMLLPGGILMLSGYTAPPWEGEAHAVEEFFYNKVLNLKKVPYSPYPRAYIVKD